MVETAAEIRRALSRQHARLMPHGISRRLVGVSPSSSPARGRQQCQQQQQQQQAAATAAATATAAAANTGEYNKATSRVAARQCCGQAVLHPQQQEEGAGPAGRPQGPGPDDGRYPSPSTRSRFTSLKSLTPNISDQRVLRVPLLVRFNLVNRPEEADSIM